MGNTKRRSYEMMLSDPYVSAHVIMKVLGCSHRKSKQIFNYVKQLELESAPIINDEPLDLRPLKVPTNLLLKTLKLNYNLLAKQYQIKYQRKEDVDVQT